MKILAIETSCDETAMALLKCGGSLQSPKCEVLENIVASQIAIHRPFGGVVPNLAKREHLKNLPKIYAQLKKKRKNLEKEIDVIAVTVGPGLEPALWTGITFAEALAERIKKPLVGANHMEGHLYSSWLPRVVESKKLKVKNSRKHPQSSISKKTLQPATFNLQPKISFPAIALVVSGGHTILLHMTAINKWTNLGETLDDAAGEAFDKVARILGLPYPGGPEIQKAAAHGDPKAITFPRPMLNKKNYEFSFSGLKTSVLYFMRDNPTAEKADVAASFQQAVIDVLTKKTMRAVREFGAKTVLLCGGVSANKPLQESLRVESRKLKANFVCPDFQFNTDNAAMIGIAAYIDMLQKKKPLPMKAQGNLSI
ncbi:MAG: tRNA (adenosine(37)-N6)-threonylcarbamoyltransferase complex transferase subunit TsaD [Patescibacteria group bacterium]|nr:tRNA (adenosine(37)-N6)-threonylcarbamoyltransferase complex transferase subunit TsaD [Patescibacteria group bacterium]